MSDETAEDAPAYGDAFRNGSPMTPGCPVSDALDMLPSEALTTLKRVVDDMGLELVVRLVRSEEEAWVLRPAVRLGVKLDRTHEPTTSRTVAVTAHPPWVRGEITVTARTLRGAVEQVMLAVEREVERGRDG